MNRRAPLVVLALGVAATVAYAVASWPRHEAAGFTGTSPHYAVTVTLDGPRTGVVDVEVAVTARDGGAITVEAVRLSATMPRMGHVTPEVVAHRTAPGRFRAHGELFVMAGVWQLGVQITGPAGTELVTVEIPIER
jgi:hypothetical protein